MRCIYIDSWRFKTFISSLQLKAPSTFNMVSQFSSVAQSCLTLCDPMDTVSKMLNIMWGHFRVWFRKAVATMDLGLWNSREDDWTLWEANTQVHIWTLLQLSVWAICRVSWMMALKKIHPNSWKLWMLYHRAMDVIKDLEKRESSRIIQVGHKCNPIYPYNRETEGVWRQQRKRPCDQEAGVGMMHLQQGMPTATRSS